MNCTLCGKGLLGASYIEYAPGQRAYFCHPTTKAERANLPDGRFSCLEYITHASRGSVPPNPYSRIAYAQAKGWVEIYNVNWL